MRLNNALANLITRVIDIFYLPLFRRFLPLHTFRYGVCGVVNFLVLDTLFYYLIYHHVVNESIVDLGFIAVSPHVASMIMVFPITFFIGFWLNRYVAFKAVEQRTSRQLFRYVLSVLGSIILSYLILKLLVEVCHVWATPAKGMTSVLTALYSYLAARYFTFTGGVKKG